MAFADGDAAEMSELLMLGLGKTGRARASAEAASARDSYHYYALTLYRQALLAPDDSVRGEDDARYRLAESVFRRCYKLVASSAQQDRRPGLWGGIRASAGWLVRLNR
jgi:hypothetical protein